MVPVRHPPTVHKATRSRSAPWTGVLIIDEADRLKTPSLEQLRDHHDRTGIGLILIGMPGIERRLARYPQLYSRIGFAHEYRPLSNDELTFVLQHHWAAIGLTLSASDFTDAEAISAVARITNGTSASSNASSRRSPASWMSTPSPRSAAKSSRPPAKPSSSATRDPPTNGRRTPPPTSQSHTPAAAVPGGKAVPLGIAATTRWCQRAGRDTGSHRRALDLRSLPCFACRSAGYCSARVAAAQRCPRACGVGARFRGRPVRT